MTILGKTQAGSIMPAVVPHEYQIQYGGLQLPFSIGLVFLWKLKP